MGFSLGAFINSFIIICESNHFVGRSALFCGGGGAILARHYNIDGPHGLPAFYASAPKNMQTFL